MTGTKIKMYVDTANSAGSACYAPAANRDSEYQTLAAAKEVDTCPSLFDFEAQDVMELTITVTDNGVSSSGNGVPIQVSGTFRVDILDVNEHPVIDDFHGHVFEHAPVGFQIHNDLTEVSNPGPLTFTAVDPATGMHNFGAQKVFSGNSWM